MTICPAKRFTPELIRVYEKSMLKNLLSGTVGELRQMGKNPHVPACVRLLAGSLFSGIEEGRPDILFGILDYFNCKTLGELLCRHLL
jgi:hypothetical protein